MPKSKTKYTNYDELTLLAQCAYLHYSQHKQQREIADELGLQPSKVSRFLKRIVKEGWIDVTFNFPEMNDVAGELCAAFGLRDAVVIPTVIPSGTKGDLRESLGQVAARYFERVVGNGAKVGISCGNTLYQMVKHIREGIKEDLQLYPMASDTSYELVDIFPSTLVGILTAKFRPKIKAFSLPTPISVKSNNRFNQPQEILNNPQVNEIFRAAQNVDVIFSGLGVVDESTPGFCALAKQELKDKYDDFLQFVKKKAGAVAEFNYVLIDKEGIPLEEKPDVRKNSEFAQVANRIIYVPLSQMRELKKQHGKLVVCVAGGEEKIEGIKALVKGKIINVLITDFNTAEKLLSARK